MERRPDGRWRFATYVWATDGRDALRAPAGGVAAAARSEDDRPYDVPAEADCRACHGGGAGSVLGFTALQLSGDRDPLAPHARPRPEEAVDLPALLQSGLLANAPRALRTLAPRVPAEGPRERAVLGYLHANCAACHAPGRAASGLDLDLEVRLGALPGPEAPGRATTVGRASRYRLPGSATDAVRVAPGVPEASVLLRRLASREPSVQMPPLGTHRVDEDARALIEAWIREDLPGRTTAPSDNGPQGQEKNP
jgi:mono/diheme cytochrome c family protein